MVAIWVDESEKKVRGGDSRMVLRGSWLGRATLDPH